jgi:phosphoenolpyruvate carboxylase
LASLDLRDHRENHTEAVAEVLAVEGIDYRGLDEAERVRLLSDAMTQDEPVIDLGAATREGLSDTAARVLELFDRLGEWQREYGSDAIDTYCISMTEEASHVLEVCFLAEQAGVIDLDGHSGLDVVPLFETEHALAEAGTILGTLLSNDAYRANVAARNGVQEAMIGYSDSGKENGFLAANWDLYCTQRRLARVAERENVTLRLFDGRGGSISRADERGVARLTDRNGLRPGQVHRTGRIDRREVREPPHRRARTRTDDRRPTARAPPRA